MFLMEPRPDYSAALVFEGKAAPVKFFQWNSPKFDLMPIGSKIKTKKIGAAIKAAPTPNYFSMKSLDVFRFMAAQNPHRAYSERQQQQRAGNNG